MKINLYVQAGFFDLEPDGRGWIESFSRALEEEKCQVFKFDSEIDKLSEFDVIHVFSKITPETWSSLATLNSKLVVTPGLTNSCIPGHSHLNRFTRFIIRMARGLSQRRWPPLDDVKWSQGPLHYMVLESGWTCFLHRILGVPLNRISTISKNPEAAAKEAVRIYHKFFYSQPTHP